MGSLLSATASRAQTRGVLAARGCETKKLYYAKIGIGTPSKDYYVQNTTLVELRLYDPKGSKTGELVTCDQDICIETFNPPACKVGSLCRYGITYGDGSSTVGYYVRDSIQLDQISGNLQTTPMNGTVAFGCGAKQFGQLGTSSHALDGILGFGQSNSSMISQLALAGKVKKSFAHCLDGTNGGGIFAIGQLVQPKLKSTPLVLNQAHYTVILKTIAVGHDALQLPTDVFDTDSGKPMIIDSGTTLAYLEDELFIPLMRKILAAQPDLKLETVEQQYTCFKFTGNVDDGFPAVTFGFENSLSLTTYPHEYLFQTEDDKWCVGWQNGGMESKDGKELNILGDLALSNKLVLYDLENQTIGWTEYNCSSSIKMKDEQSSAVHLVGPNNLSSAHTLNTRLTLKLLFVLVILHSYLS
ncbi:hypothetical protein U1Q18_025771 [Sarracenia purpurea var. burkii]